MISTSGTQTEREARMRTPRWNHIKLWGLRLVGAAWLLLAVVMLAMALAKHVITTGDPQVAACITAQTQAGLSWNEAAALCRLSQE